MGEKEEEEVPTLGNIDSIEEAPKLNYCNEQICQEEQKKSETNNLTNKYKCLENLTKSQLIDECRKRELDSSGSKVQLLERIGNAFKRKMSYEHKNRSDDPASINEQNFIVNAGKETFEPIQDQQLEQWTKQK